MKSERAVKGMFLAGMIGAWATLAAQHAEANPAIRFKLVEGTRIVVPVVVDEAGPFNFLLDTGASVTVLDERLADRLKLYATSTTRLRTFAGGTTAPLARVAKLSLGTKTVEGMLVVCGNLQRLFSLESRIEGILGQDFLSCFNYLISYKEKSICFDDDGNLKERLQGTRVPIEKGLDKPYITAELPLAGKRLLRFLLDSGASVPLIFGTPALELGFEIAHSFGQEFTASSSGGSPSLQACRPTALRLGDLTLRNVQIFKKQTGSEERPYQDGNLPTTLFKSIYFDNDNHMVILNPRLPM